MCLCVCIFVCTSVYCPSLSTDIPLDSQIHGKYKRQNSIPYTIVSLSYDGYVCKLLQIIFSMASIHINLFAV